MNRGLAAALLLCQNKGKGLRAPLVRRLGCSDSQVLARLPLAPLLAFSHSQCHELLPRNQDPLRTWCRAGTVVSGLL